MSSDKRQRFKDTTWHSSRDVVRWCGCWPHVICAQTNAMTGKVLPATPLHHEHPINHCATTTRIWLNSLALQENNLLGCDGQASQGFFCNYLEGALRFLDTENEKALLLLFTRKPALEYPSCNVLTWLISRVSKNSADRQRPEQAQAMGSRWDLEAVLLPHYYRHWLHSHYCLQPGRLEWLF